MALCQKINTISKEFDTYPKNFALFFICLTKFCFKQLVKLFCSESGFNN